MAKKRFSLDYAWIPLTSLVVWLGMLTTLLIYWVAMGRPHYQRALHSVVFISDIGIKVQPLFIACSFIIALGFAFSFIADKHLRRKGHLAGAEDRRERIFAALTITCGIISAFALVMLSFYDIRRKQTIHFNFVMIFVFGVGASGIFSALQFRYLYHHNPQCTNLFISFVLKVALMIVGLFLFFIGLIFSQNDMNGTAIIEWCISLIFSFFLVTLIYDLLPARTQEVIYSKTLNQEKLIEDFSP